MTATPVLVGAKDALNAGLGGHFTPDQLAGMIDNLSVGYALAYLVGLVSLIVLANFMPKFQKENLEHSAQKIAAERGLGNSSQRKVYLPIIRAYRVGPELINWWMAVTCASWVSTARPVVTLSVSAVTVFLPTRMVTPFCRKAMKLPGGLPGQPRAPRPFIPKR